MMQSGCQYIFELFWTLIFMIRIISCWDDEDKVRPERFPQIYFMIYGNKVALRWI